MSDDAVVHSIDLGLPRWKLYHPSDTLCVAHTINWVRSQCAMLSGAWPFSARWVSSRILNSTRTAIGSQCNFFSNGVAWRRRLSGLPSFVFSEAVVFASEAVDRAVHCQYPVCLWQMHEQFALSLLLSDTVWSSRCCGGGIWLTCIQQSRGTPSSSQHQTAHRDFEQSQSP